MLARLRGFAPREGWRAFAGEVGVIVLGVLIAVAIGKVVEALDWRDRVAGAKIALEQDILENSFYGFNERVEITPCLRRQLARLEAALLSGGVAEQRRVPTHAGVIYTSVYVHPSRGWSALEWSSAVADNIPAHMTREDRAFYRTHYLEVGIMDSLNAEENRELADLDLMARPFPLPDATRADLLRTVLRERQRVDLMDAIARYSLRQVRGSGRRYAIPAAERAQMNTLNWCRANGLT